MLTHEQYAAIGKVALAANELEYVVEAYLIYLLGTSEFELSSTLVLREPSLNRKLQLFRQVLSVIEVEYPELKLKIGEARCLLDSAEKN